jgi:hypothetical protein
MFSSYRTVNTLNLDHKYQSVNAIQGDEGYVLEQLHKTHKHYCPRLTRTALTLGGAKGMTCILRSEFKMQWAEVQLYNTCYPVLYG